MDTSRRTPINIAHANFQTPERDLTTTRTISYRRKPTKHLELTKDETLYGMSVDWYLCVNKLGADLCSILLHDYFFSQPQLGQLQVDGGCAFATAVHFTSEGADSGCGKRGESGSHRA